MGFCIVGLAQSKGPGAMNLNAWIHSSGHVCLHTSLIYAYLYTTLPVYKTPHQHIPEGHNQ